MLYGVDFVVVDGCDWRCIRVLYQHIYLLQADGQAEVLAGLREAVHQRLEFLLGVGLNCRVISKQHISDESFPYFGFGSEAGEFEQRAVSTSTHFGAKGTFQ